MCDKCPLNSKNLNKLTLLDKFWRLVNTNNDFCTKCKCGIKGKTISEIESCPIGKWKSVI